MNTITTKRNECLVTIEDFKTPSWTRDTNITIGIKKMLINGEISLNDIIGAYQHYKMMDTIGNEAIDEMYFDYQTIEAENKKFRKLATKYSETLDALQENQIKKRKLLSRVGGFIDLSKYRKAWVKKHGRLRSWVPALSIYFDEKSIEYRLAVLLDEATRLKAKASRLKRQLKWLGELSIESQDGPLGISDF